MKRAASFLLLAGLAGCRRAQSYSLLGSYFPAWLFCIAGGIGLASVVYFILQKLGREGELAPALLVWPSLALLLTLGLWLALYSVV